MSTIVQHPELYHVPKRPVLWLAIARHLKMSSKQRFLAAVHYQPYLGYEGDGRHTKQLAAHQEQVAQKEWISWKERVWRKQPGMDLAAEEGGDARTVQRFLDSFTKVVNHWFANRFRLIML